MKKYILLIVPIVFLWLDLKPYLHLSQFEFNFIAMQAIVNMVIVSILLAVLLRRTTLRSIVNWLIGICFSVYFCVLFMETVQISLLYEVRSVLTSEEVKGILMRSTNFIPFQGIVETIRYNPSALFQIIGNMLMLTPLAFSMLYFKWVSHVKQAIWYSFLCTVSIEFIQFLQTCVQYLFGIGQGRSADIDDVILNTVGAVIGVLCYVVWSRLTNRFNKKVARVSA